MSYESERSSQFNENVHLLESPNRNNLPVSYTNKIEEIKR